MLIVTVKKGGIEKSLKLLKRKLINTNQNEILLNKKDDFVVSLPIITRQNTTSSCSPQSDCFLSHNWGENHINHQRVHQINIELQKRGLKTWFDENKIDGEEDVDDDSGDDDNNDDDNDDDESNDNDGD